MFTSTDARNITNANLKGLEEVISIIHTMAGQGMPSVEFRTFEFKDLRKTKTELEALGYKLSDVPHDTLRVSWPN